MWLRKTIFRFKIWALKKLASHVSNYERYHLIAEVTDPVLTPREYPTAAHTTFESRWRNVREAVYDLDRITQCPDLRQYVPRTRREAATLSLYDFFSGKDGAPVDRVEAVSDFKKTLLQCIERCRDIGVDDELRDQSRAAYYTLKEAVQLMEVVHTYVFSAG